mgnify:CR=1 FL=1
MKRISIDDLTGFADICECERFLGELVAGCISIPSAPPSGPNGPREVPADKYTPLEGESGSNRPTMTWK